MTNTEYSVYIGEYVILISHDSTIIEHGILMEHTDKTVLTSQTGLASDVKYTPKTFIDKVILQ